jgi:uncharacterized protein (DUF1501 family)
MNRWNLCESISRRDLLKATGAGLIGLALGPSALAQLVVREQGESHCLVVVFLRGGADGLNWVIPAFEDEYYRARPSIGIRQRDSLEYDGKFRLHAAMSALRPWLESGELQMTHACGSGDQTRSHFSAMSLMERGLFRPESQFEGWLSTYLRMTERESAALRAVAIGSVLPESLTGSSALALESLDRLRLESDDESALRQLRELYREDASAVGASGDRLFRALDRLKSLNNGSYRPAQGAKYPTSDLAEGLRQVAMLIKSGVGIEVAALDRGNWDTHVAQGSTDGWFAGNVADVAQSLAAFATDLGDHRKHVTVVVQTEFGRRLHENVALGTDHGRGSIMMVLGAAGPVRVRGDWPGLREQDLDEVGDLRVANDYRLVLAEVLRDRLGQPLAADALLRGPGTTKA